MTTQDLQAARNEHPGYTVREFIEDDLTIYVYIDRDGEPFAAWKLGPGVSDIVVYAAA